MARSTVVRRTIALAGTGMLAGLGLLAAAGPAAADSAPIAPVAVSAAHFEHSDWTWCPYGYYWHHEGLLSGLLDGTGHLLGALL